MQNKIPIKIKGMQRDFSESASNPNLAFENKNIRIMATNDNTTLSVTNEKGNILATVEGLPNNTISGTPIGQAVLNNQLVIFTSTSCIYKIWLENDEYNCTILYDGTTKGSLNLSDEHPIESIVFYENDNIQKVYWVDGINQPRMINIAATQEEIDSWINTSFDFIQPVELKDTIELSKSFNSGNFSPGVIQYAFSYFNKYSNESPIINQTDLGYITPQDKGAAADEVVSCNFNITIENLDIKWDYIRLYSIQRTSLDATPIVKVVGDYDTIGTSSYNKVKTTIIGISTNTSRVILENGMENSLEDYFKQDPDDWYYIDEVNYTLVLRYNEDREEIRINTTGVSTIILQGDNTGYADGHVTYNDIDNPVMTTTIIDNGTTGYTIDPTLLLYIGGEQLIANTINHKDGTLFLGGVSITPNRVDDSIKEEILKITDSIQYTSNKQIDIGNADGQYYINTNQNNLSSSKFKTFKSRETYRLGVQLQDYKGKWSEPIFLGDYTNTITLQHSYNGNLVNIAQIEASLEDGVSDFGTVLDKYIRIRPIIVFPDSNNQEVICQGVVNPTVFNYNDRKNNSPYVQASWYFRPINNTSHSTNSAISSSSIEFLHNTPLKNNWRGGSELQYMQDASSTMLADTTENSYDFFVDSTIVTLNSPEIEFNNVNTNSNDKFRIIGIIPITSTYSDLELQTSTVGSNTDITNYIPQYLRHANNSSNSKYTLSVKRAWRDTFKDSLDAYYNIYTWHRSGSLRNVANPDSNGYTPAMLQYNKNSTFRFSQRSVYSSNFWMPKYGSSDIQISNDDTANFLKSADNNYYSEEYLYLKDIDKVIAPTKSYSIISSTSRESGIVDTTYLADTPVSMKYKSTSHAIVVNNIGIEERNIQTGEMEDVTAYKRHIILPNIISKSVSLTEDNYYWQKDVPTNQNGNWWLSDLLSVNNPYPVEYGFLLIGEIYREIDNKFGGDSEQALTANQWVAAGPAVDLYDIVNINKTLIWNDGDTYYQRYDCLKTYPYTLEDVNSVTDILSFMVETRINLDGRYDNNKGRLSNLVTTPTIWNLINPVYSQSNNFFNYRILQDYLYENTIFKNTITWSLTKQNNSLIDTWLSIGFINTLDLDGDKGQLRTIKRYNNELIAFQDTGISNILFNSRTQLATEQGVPIEIANSGKVDGKRYLTSSIGCSNKWSICETPKGLYFIDSSNKSIYLFNGQFDNISDRLGFHSWINSNIDSVDSWTPKDFKSFITYYDKVNKEVLFVKDDTCLGFSETLGNFSSFYSYEGMYYLSNINDRSISLGTYQDLAAYGFFRHQEGDYNMFYNQYQPFYTTIIANPSITEDKIFNNIEFRSDSWNVENVANPVLEDNTFDILDVWNEYQRGTSSLSDILGKPSNLKKKFRIWRANIPRDNANKRDRIRNTWCYIKLEKQTPNTLKTVLHDLTVYYI